MATIATTVKPARMNARRSDLRRQDTIVGWLLVAPSLIIILGVTLQPVLSTLYISFFDAPTSINLTGTFIGFGNYSSILQDSVLWQTIWRTLYFMATSVALELILGIGIAQLINTRPPGWKFLRISLIIPWAVPTIVSGAMWSWLYNDDYGALNGLLYQIA